MGSATKLSADEWIEKRFRNMRALSAAPVAVAKSIAVVSTPRCGSTLFCTSLASTGLFGDPSEWLNPRHVAAFGRVWNLERVHLGRYLNHVIAATTSPNGVFSLNFHVEQYLHWRRNGFDLMSLGFDHVIYLSRRDKIAQAHSLARAMLTDQWQAHLAGRRELGPQGVGILGVLKHLRALVEWDEGFNRMFSAIVTARYAYEDFAADPRVYRDAMVACRIDVPPGSAFTSSLSRQRSEDDEDRIAAIKAYLLDASGNGREVR